MNPIYVSTAASIIFYIFYFTGIVLCEYDNIIVLVNRYRLKHRLDPKVEEGKIFILARNLLAGAFGKEIDGIWLVISVCLIFIISFFVGVRNLSFISSLLLASFCAAMPLMVLYSKVQSMRNKGSREGISLLSELYRQYKMNNLNMIKALEQTISSEGDFKICKKQLYILLIRLQDAASKKEIRACCKNLAFALGTNWSRSLATCIEISATKGTDVSLALIDVIEQLKTAKQMAEERKRLNGESMRMTVFLVPLLYILTIIVSLKYLNMSIVKFVSNQFFTPKGLFLFIVNLFLFVINLTIMNLIDSARMDY